MTPPGTPEPPDWLSDRAKEIWRAFAEVYEITAADYLTFTQACDSYARWEELTQSANQVAPVVLVKGEAVTNPHLVRADKDARNFRDALQHMFRNRPKGMSDGEETDEVQDEAPNLEERRALLLAKYRGDSDQPGAIGGGRAPLERTKSRPAAEEQARPETKSRRAPVSEEEAKGSRAPTGKKPRRT